MEKVQLGRRKFGVDCEEIDARNCGVSDADCASLGARMQSGEMSRLKILRLVRLFCIVVVSSYALGLWGSCDM